MKIKLGNTIAFSVLVIGCICLEIFASGAGALWILVVLYVIFGDFDDVSKKNKK